MSYLPAYFGFLTAQQGLPADRAADRLGLVQNKFASAAQRKWFFANLAADKATGGGGGKSGVTSGGGSTPKQVGKEPQEPKMKRIEKGHYETEINGHKVKIYQHEEREYYTRSSGRGDRAESRMNRDWGFAVRSLGIDPNRGYGTKKQAFAAAKRSVEIRTQREGGDG